MFRTQWITLILAGLCGTGAFILVPETFAPVLLARRAKRIRHSTGDWAIHAKHEEKAISMRDVAEDYLMRPLRMLLLEPILDLLTIYMAFIYGEHLEIRRGFLYSRMEIQACSTSSSRPFPSRTPSKDAGNRASPPSLSLQYLSECSWAAP